jgi:hydrogenase expression/formation protein HypE
MIAAAMNGQRIELGHGAGGAMGQRLVEELIVPRLGSAYGGLMEDSALLQFEGRRVALSTDSFVIDPIFFGSGDIGRLAVCGTINDLAVSGAVPRYLTLSLVLEEGLPIGDLERILDSVRDAALETGVEVVAGDTKVVRDGELDKLVVNTTGVGELPAELALGVGHIRPGDALIVTGRLGSHGIHILALRAGLEDFAQQVHSDCAPLDGLVWNLLEEHAPQVHCMRDVTRGGFAGVVCELAAAAGVAVRVQEPRLPFQSETMNAAAVLGVDPLYLPNEGCICMFVDAAAAEEILELLRWQPQGREAEIVGYVEDCGAGVTLECADRELRALRADGAAQLPRLG